METTEIMKEKDIRKMITAYMIDELQKHDDYVLTNISYGNVFFLTLNIYPHMLYKYLS